MQFGKATEKDIPSLIGLRIAYLEEDLGPIDKEDLHAIETALPAYFQNHLNKDLMVYAAREADTIVSCAFLLVVEKPASPAFITGKTGTVMNVYTRPEYRHKGLARKLMTLLVDDAKAMGISVVDLKATEAGYPLYRSVGFEERPARYRQMSIRFPRGEDSL